MGILVWGFGNYYCKKEKSIPKDKILAFVSSRETGQFQGINIIKPLDMAQYHYGKLYIMVGVDTLFEVLKELRAIGYREWNRVILGWNLEPYTEEEAVLLADGRFQCDAEGICRYYLPGETIEIENNNDWERIKQRIVRKRNKNELAEVPLQPISNVFGFDRGQPIDRYYIDKFLSQNSDKIRGTVFEVADREYTMKYGKNVKESVVTHISRHSDNGSRLVNLETGEGVEEGLADCFILTQTLPFIYDIRTAANNVIRLLKNGGTALVTVSGISQISRYDMDRWGHYWSFTTLSLKRLFEECEAVESVEVKSYGNVKTAISGLYGLAVEDLAQEDLEYWDDDYQQIIVAIVKKKGNV